MARVLVVGGGVAGLQAATDLVRLRPHEVYLIEKNPFVGGKLHDLERTFPSDDCSLCRLAPHGCFLCIKSPFPPAGFRGLRVLTDTEVVGLQGQPGHYLATLRDGGGATFSAPWPFSAVILAPGCTEFNPGGLERLRYGRHPDVVTASRYEDMLAAGQLRRPSDGAPVTRVAWVQCVGARDISLGRPLCSVVCCGYAIKQAAVTRNLSPEIQTTVFVQDLRTPDLTLARYVRRAVHDLDIRVIHHRVHSVEVDDQDHLIIRYADEDGSVYTRPFDLVVLSVGLEPDPLSGHLARGLGIEPDAWGFCPSDPRWPCRTVRPGVFVAGSFSEPADVKTSLIAASAAAAACAAFLDSLEQTAPAALEVLSTPDLVPVPQVPPSEDGDAPAAVLICRCRHAPGCDEFVNAMRQNLERSPGVAELVVLPDCPLAGDCHGLLPVAARHGRIVLAACSPRACEAALRTALGAGAGHLRVAQVYASANSNGQLGALPLPRALAALRAALVPVASSPGGGANPGAAGTSPPPVLIVGGGAAGLSCALTLADLGIHSYLVEREASPGGQMLTSGTGALAPGLRQQLQDLADRARRHPLVHLYLRSQVVRAQRTGESWKVVLGSARPQTPPPEEMPPGDTAWGETPPGDTSPGQQTLSCGAVVVATGGEARPVLPGLVQRGGDAVVTLPQLEELIASGIPLGSAGATGPVVIVLCAGDATPAYCSKVCCQQAVRCALSLKSSRPTTEVLVLFRDMCTPARAELEYNEARHRGVRFVRLPPNSPPQLTWQEGGPGGKRVALTYRDPIVAEDVTVFPLLVAVGCGVAPAPGLDRLAATFGIPLDEDGFVSPRHPKVRPVETPVSGIFACGSAAGPATVQEALAQGMATATRVATFLREHQPAPRVATIAGACSACLTCLRLCSAGAIKLEGGKPRVDPSSCQGCGICAAECPAQAIVLSWPRPGDLAAELEAALGPGTAAAAGDAACKLVVFACSHCGSTAVERSSLFFPPGTRVIGVPCVGSVDESLMLKAFTLGARGIILAGCRQGQCHYGAGPDRAGKRAERVRAILAQLGIQEAAVSVMELTPDRSPVLVETLAAISSAAQAGVYAGG